jgi:hypothetical protein
MYSYGHGSGNRTIHVRIGFFHLFSATKVSPPRRCNPRQGFLARGNATCKVSVTYHFSLSIVFTPQSPMADPSQQLPPGWTAEWWVRLSFSLFLFIEDLFREPDNQRYLFVGASRPL